MDTWSKVWYTRRGPFRLVKLGWDLRKGIVEETWSQAQDEPWQQGQGHQYELQAPTRAGSKPPSDEPWQQGQGQAGQGQGQGDQYMSGKPKQGRKDEGKAKDKGKANMIKIGAASPGRNDKGKGKAKGKGKPKQGRKVKD